MTDKQTDAPLSAEDQFTMAHNVLNRIDMLLAEAGFSQESTARFQLKIAKSMFRQAENGRYYAEQHKLVEPSGETPLTDALITDPLTERESVLFLHARTLERELAALRSQSSSIDAMRGECHDAAERGQGCFRALKAERELAVAKAAEEKWIKEANRLAFNAARSATVPPNDGKSHINHPLRHFDRTCLACWWEADEESVP